MVDPQRRDDGARAPGTVGSERSPGPGSGPAAREELARRTCAILEREPSALTAEQAEQDRAVTRECRYLLRLLATRRRSAAEMRRRIEQREVPAAVVHEVMARIDRAGLIDDAAFARDWVEQRRVLKALSDQALRRELEQRGVAGTLIDDALMAGEGEEEQRCRELVRSRLSSSDRAALRRDDGRHRQRLARRLDALLTRKGYPGDLAVHVISGELRSAAE